jgi:hypothetical protein
VNDRRRKAVSVSYPPLVFERITDLLAELVLEDMRALPLLNDLKTIDTVEIEENTAALALRGAS